MCWYACCAAVFIPGPIIFGLLYDSTCLLWQDVDCEEEDGTCILYNMNRCNSRRIS